MKNTSILLLLLVVFPNCSNHRDPKGIGYVSAASPEATAAGLKVLREGGNAVDAAIAISFALGVTEPAMSGLGGGTQVLLYTPITKEVLAINGTTFSPKYVPDSVLSKDVWGRRKSTIPSTVKVLDFLFKKFGSGEITWSQLLDPAVDYAENGFSIGRFRNLVFKRHEDDLVTDSIVNKIFLVNGRAPEVNSILQQPILANTLRKLQTAGAADFYSGEIAKEIANDMQRTGGWITEDDLRNFQEPKIIKPIQTNYNGLHVFTMPPPCGGWTLLLGLNALGAVENDGETDELVNITRALRIAHNDRLENPIVKLEDYDEEVRQKFSQEYLELKLAREDSDESGETTHFSVVDKDGMVVSVTASINAYFGSRTASPTLGFLYNTYMDDFEYGKPGHPFGIKPNAMAYSSMCPTIVLKDSEPVLVLGSPGSARIISSVLQVIHYWSTGKPIEEVVAQSRIHTNRDRVYVESKSDSMVLSQFVNEHGLQFGTYSVDLANGNLNPYFGGIHAIAKEGELWKAVADPRRDGVGKSTID